MERRLKQIPPTLVHYYKEPLFFIPGKSSKRLCLGNTPTRLTHWRVRPGNLEDGLCFKARIGRCINDQSDNQKKSLG